MKKVGIIGVGQSNFVRGYPGSIRELAFEGFKGAMEDAKIQTKDIDASIIAMITDVSVTATRSTSSSGSEISAWSSMCP